MRIISAILILCLFSGCLGIPFILGSGGISNLVGEGVVECSINVGIERLWRASILEFRKTEIIEADKDNYYIKSKYKDVIIEFKAKSLDDIHSFFRIRAFNLEGKPQSEIAQRFSVKIYKRARSLWFSLIQFSKED
ncbi:MAG TPA: hypothetical protein ENI31_06295 [Candidatus Omnitrophica bacterium]|nr:MAG: hypothetical protein DRP61_03410 [Candidatus Omnitrophota bacterium]RKY43583.1 MAG: hypothetical protein DRP80_04800 [Candidatus Omnitrophota bacterium]HEC69874.1 hypothetical protein [Candidatus Omnitrophota bacterium]